MYFANSDFVRCGVIIHGVTVIIKMYVWIFDVVLRENTSLICSAGTLASIEHYPPQQNFGCPHCHFVLNQPNIHTDVVRILMFIFALLEQGSRA